MPQDPNEQRGKKRRTRPPTSPTGTRSRSSPYPRTRGTNIFAGINTPTTTQMSRSVSDITQDDSEGGSSRRRRGASERPSSPTSSGATGTGATGVLFAQGSTSSPRRSARSALSPSSEMLLETRSSDSNDSIVANLGSPIGERRSKIKKSPLSPVMPLVNYESGASSSTDQFAGLTAEQRFDKANNGMKGVNSIVDCRWQDVIDVAKDGENDDDGNAKVFSAFGEHSGRSMPEKMRFHNDVAQRSTTHPHASPRTQFDL